MIPGLPDNPHANPKGHYAAWVSNQLARGDQPDAAEIHQLKQNGCNSVANLRIEDDSDRVPCRKEGLGYLRLSIHDHLPPTYDQVHQFLDFTQDPKNQPVFVHCQAGLGRTGVMVACYRMAVEGWSLKQALADGFRYGFASEEINPLQVVFLKKWAASLAAGEIPGYPLKASSARRSAQGT